MTSVRIELVVERGNCSQRLSIPELGSVIINSFGFFGILVSGGNGLSFQG
jgi:hypothetical protein